MQAKLLKLTSLLTGWLFFMHILTVTVLTCVICFWYRWLVLGFEFCSFFFPHCLWYRLLPSNNLIEMDFKGLESL